MTTRSKLETTFTPSVHGMPFPNTWETVLFDVTVAGRPVKLALRGFCGGMSFLALDLHRVGREAPSEPVGELPDRRSPLGRYIWRRQVESLADGLGPEHARIREDVVLAARWPDRLGHRHTHS